MPHQRVGTDTGRVRKPDNGNLGRTCVGPPNTKP